MDGGAGVSRVVLERKPIGEAIRRTTYELWLQ